MSRNDNLNQFDDLIDELQRADERPSTTRAFKKELRGQLLDQYEQSSFSLANLGQWAGTAVALGVLGFIIVYAWSVISRPGAFGGPVDVTRPVLPTPEPTILPVETAVPPPAQHDANDVWLISATQHARSSADAAVTLEITVGYQFESDEEVMLIPLYANPNWESASGGRIPIDGLSEAITLTEKSGTQTITFSASPAEMRQIVGTDQPVLVMQLGYLSEGANGRRELNILAMPTLTDFLDLTRTEKMVITGDRLWIVKATQLPRNHPDKAITLEVTVGYKLVTAEEAVLSLSFIHPEWETHMSLDEIHYPNYNALGDSFPVQAGTGSVTLTATVEPESITSAIGSDEFRLMTRFWATDEDSQQTSDLILMGFDNGMTFDAQSLEKIMFVAEAEETAVSEQESTRTIADWTVHDFGYTPWILGEVPAMKPILAGVTAVHGQYILSYELNGQPAIALAQGLGLNEKWDSEPEIVELPWATVELGAIEPPGPPGWIALVRPYQDGTEQKPNISLLVEVPDRELVFQLIESLVPAE